MNSLMENLKMAARGIDFIVELKKAVNRGEIEFYIQNNEIYVESKRGEVAMLTNTFETKKVGHQGILGLT